MPPIPPKDYVGARIPEKLQAEQEFWELQFGGGLVSKDHLKVVLTR